MEVAGRIQVTKLYDFRLEIWIQRIQRIDEKGGGFLFLPLGMIHQDYYYMLCHDTKTNLHMKGHGAI